MANSFCRCLLPGWLGQALTGRTRRCTIWVAVLLPLTSCQDPAYKQEQTVRDQRVEELRRQYVARTHESGQNLEDLSELSKDLRVRRMKNLDRTLHWAEERDRRKKNQLKKQEPLRRERTRTIFRGKPETIPATWAKLVY